jgi:hypothetical protein
MPSIEHVIEGFADRNVLGPIARCQHIQPITMTPNLPMSSVRYVSNAYANGAGRAIGRLAGVWSRLGYHSHQLKTAPNVMCLTLVWF